MAPEVGLEPTTHRLTADCSTIELLWNPKRGVIYAAPPPASNRFCPAVTLAPRTVERAARGLDDSLNRRPAPQARLAPAVINAQSLLISTTRIRGPSVVEQPVPRPRSIPIQRNRAAKVDGFLQHRADRPPQAAHLRGGQTLGPRARRNAGAKQRLARVDIPHTGKQGLVEQLDFDRLCRPLQPRGKIGEGELFTEWFGSKAAERRGVQ